MANTGQSAAVVTPSDTVANEWEYLYVAADGNVVFMPRSSSQSITLAVVAGQWLWVKTRLVLSTGTTATVVGFR